MQFFNASPHEKYGSSHSMHTLSRYATNTQHHPSHRPLKVTKTRRPVYCVTHVKDKVE